jgi:hypothetical protein
MLPNETLTEVNIGKTLKKFFTRQAVYSINEKQENTDHPWIKA